MIRLDDEQFFRMAAGLPYVVRVAYYAGKQLPNGRFEPHPSDHVDWMLPNGKQHAGYRGSVPQRGLEY